MEENMIVIRNLKTCSFRSGWPKYNAANLKHEMEYIIKSNESFAEIKTKNEIEQLLLRYKDKNNIHEHGKQQNE